MDASRYTTGFAINGLMGSICQFMGVAPSKRGQRNAVCRACGGAHATKSCVAEVPVAKPAPVAKPTNTVKPTVVGFKLPPTEEARLKAITSSGARYKPRPILASDIKSIQSCKCGNETHYVAVLASGEITPLNHNRQLFRLESWVTKTTKGEGEVKRKGCAKLFFDMAWALDEKKRNQANAARRRAEYSEEKKKDLFPVRTRYMAKFKTVVEKFFEDRFSKNLVVNSNDRDLQHPRLSVSKHHRSGRVSGMMLSLNVIRWYQRIYMNRLHELRDGVITLDVIAMYEGLPSRVVCLRRGKNGPEIVEADVTWRTGKARLSTR